MTNRGPEDAMWQENEFPTATASDAELAELNAFENVIHAESWPGHGVISLQQTTSRLGPSSPDTRSSLWVIRRIDGCGIVAIAGIFLFVAKHSKRLMFFDVSVVPEMRRKGLARRLLKRVVDTGTREGRCLLQARTFSTVPAGEAFMEHLGARLGRTRHVNQLVLADLERDKLRVWQESARSDASFQIGIWRGSYPDEDLACMCALHDAASVPLSSENLEREDAVATPDHLRRREAALEAENAERWTAYVRARDTSDVVGYTEVIWNPLVPETLDQGMTCVLPEYRNRGLGRAIKAAMLDAVMRERPTVKRVLTGNETTNAPMLKINHELGFLPLMVRKDWQIDVEQVMAYLARTEPSGFVRGS